MTASKGEAGRRGCESDPDLPMPKNDDTRFDGVGRDVVSRYEEGADESRLSAAAPCWDPSLVSLDLRL